MSLTNLIISDLQNSILFLSNNPSIDPVLGQCAVTVELFTFISAKNLLYRLINLPLIKVLVNFIIFNLYLYMSNKKEIIAGIIIIGNEVLSGRTKDINTSTLATWLNSLGVKVKEVKIIPDDEQTIINTVNQYRKSYDYVFTTGGIGPTHDDITAESISKAFNIEYGFHKEAYSILESYYKPPLKWITWFLCRKRFLFTWSTINNAVNAWKFNK